MRNGFRSRRTFATCLPKICLAFLILQFLSAWGKDGEIQLRSEGTNTLVQINGSNNDDWLVQSSTDLVTWSTLTNVAPLLSAGSNAPTRSIPTPSEASQFYRAVKTTGLYDLTLLRTISLTFTQANWQTLLTSGRTTGSNTLAHLTVNNGADIAGVGARYKGNTSFQIGGQKKSINIEIDYTNATADLMGYTTINLNNAAGDETIMREPVYFTVLQRYAPGPKGSLAKLYINGAYWGVYSLAQQEDGDLINEWFPSNEGDRWRAPNAGGGGGPGGGGGGGGFSSPLSALSWQGTNISTYQRYYELKKQNTTNAWASLVHAIDVLNNTPAAELREKVEDVLAVDSWLWFLAVENIFADDDSYWNKGADYGFYYEPESGRLHPIEHDGNESFMAGDVRMTPVQGATASNRPVLYRLLPIPELRQRYLAHLRTVLAEAFNPAAMTPLIDQLHALSVSDVIADPIKNFTMVSYTNDLKALKSFVTNRHNFLLSHAEVSPLPPVIKAVSQPGSPAAGSPATVTAEVQAQGDAGLNSVWLYFRAGPVGKFTRTQMFDDGAHGDGAAGDGVFGGETAGFVAGTKVRYYVEARSGNAAKAAAFAPARAEQVAYSYRVTTSAGTESPVVINEFMAENGSTLADPQGQFDDWIELHNLTAEQVDLTGHYLSDNLANPRKWQFPDGTRIAAGGYLLIWADENGTDTPGLHASFKLASDGETILFVDSDGNNNALLDSITFGPQTKNSSYGRSAANPDQWTGQTPTPGEANR